MKKCSLIIVLGVFLAGSFWLTYASTRAGMSVLSAQAEQIYNGMSVLDTDTVVNLNKNAKAAALADADSGKILYAYEENRRLPIASMVKIMTALIAFEEIDAGNMSMEEKITISERSAGMGGSQMFLDAGSEYTVSDLLKGVIVVSANDACVALAERISGSVEVFVSKMNERAKALNMNDTLFCNCTGLPAESEQYCSAADVVKMYGQLIKHERFFEYSRIWLEDYHHPDGRVTMFTNTNKLIRQMPEIEGGKTGFTNQAGFCVTVSAKKNDMHLISVVIGANESKQRFGEAKELLQYGFANYETCDVLKDVELPQCTVRRGKVKTCKVVADNSVKVLYKKGEKPDIKVETELYELKAPVQEGAEAGRITVYVDGTEYGKIGLKSAESVDKAGLGDYIGRLVENMGR